MSCIAGEATHTKVILQQLKHVHNFSCCHIKVQPCHIKMLCGYLRDSNRLLDLSMETCSSKTSLRSNTTYCDLWHVFKTKSMQSLNWSSGFYLFPHKVTCIIVGRPVWKLNAHIMNFGDLLNFDPLGPHHSPVVLLWNHTFNGNLGFLLAHKNITKSVLKLFN